MIQHVTVGKLGFPDLRLRSSEIHKVRGYFSDRFRQFDLMHNHRQGTERLYYRYPAIQFKLKDFVSVHAYRDEGIDILKQVFFKSDEVVIEGRKMLLHEKSMAVDDVPFGEDGNLFLYSFASPWLALNQDNYKKYRTLHSELQKRKLLQAILINNIMAFCKFAGYTVKERLKPEVLVREESVNLKGKTHVGFVGLFKVNFLLPDGLGLGKSSSRGYGNILRQT